eukprot:6206559-Pleurochrysis_carterae.AAC.1
MHEQLDGCTAAALQALGDNPGTVKKDEAAWRKYWVPLAELLGVARWREIPTTPDAILQEARLLCKVVLLVLATMRPRRPAHPDPHQATTSSGRFGVCTSKRAGTWSKRSTCVAPWTACSSNSLSSTGTRPSCRGVSSPCPMPFSAASLPPPPCPKARFFAQASFPRFVCSASAVFAKQSLSRTYRNARPGLLRSRVPAGWAIRVLSTE